MLIALNAKLDAADARLNAKMDIILKKINDTDTKMEHIITKNTHLVYQLENVKKELSDLQIHMLHGHQMMIDNNADNNADNNYNYCS
jgi:regulator of replication initiation timing